MNINMELGDASMASLMGIKPAKPKVHNPFYEATELEKQNKHADAQKIYKELMNDNFDNSVLQAALGMNFAIQGDNGLAHALLSKALDGMQNMPADFKALGVIARDDVPGGVDLFLKTKRAEIMNAIGSCFKHENKTTKARYWFERAQQIVPPNADIQNNLATLHINEGSPEKAIAHLDKAVSLQADHPQAHWNRSLAYLEMGDYERGFAEYGWGRKAEVRQDRNYNMTGDTPEWDGTPGKVVVVYGEQGIGDEIMFMSIIPEMMRDCRTVIIDCHKRLHRLFCNSFPELAIYPTREDEKITWPYKADRTERHGVQAKISIGDLGKFYRRKLEDFPGKPYINPTEDVEKKWADRLAKLPAGPNIGIHWLGGHKKTRIEVRSMKLEQMLPILKDRDCNFISLQYTDCANEITAFEAAHGIKIHQFDDAVKAEDYNECAGLVANLDLVITVCTSVVHLAGSMGVPTWVMTPSRPAWRYGVEGGPAGDVMPWYGDTVLLFRQKRNVSEWNDVVAEVASNLTDLLESK